VTGGNNLENLLRAEEKWKARVMEEEFKESYRYDAINLTHLL
jgi:hypothetical protein